MRSHPKWYIYLLLFVVGTVIGSAFAACAYEVVDFVEEKIQIHQHEAYQQ